MEDEQNAGFGRVMNSDRSSMLKYMSIFKFFWLGFCVLFTLLAVAAFGYFLYGYLSPNHTLPGTEQEASLAFVLVPLGMALWGIMLFLLGRSFFRKAEAGLDDGAKGKVKVDIRVVTEDQLPQLNLFEKFFSKLPLIALLAVNALPLVGVLFFEWDTFLIVLLYWSENVAVGFYNVLKMATVKVKHPAEHLGKLFAIPFFIIHYSGFTGIHGVFVLAMFKKEGDVFGKGPDWPCFLVFVQILFQTIAQAYRAIPISVRWVIAGMFVSHGISFMYNYLYKGEYAKISPDMLMMQPYARVVVMHIAIIFGGFLTMAFGSPVGLLVMLVIIKTLIDVALHNRQHMTVQKKK